MIDNVRHVTKSDPGQPGTTLYYSQLHFRAATRAAGLGIGEHPKIFAALQSRWKDLPAIAGLPDDEFKAAVQKIVDGPSA
jgi:hypothetical protein